MNRIIPKVKPHALVKRYFSYSTLYSNSKICGKEITKGIGLAYGMACGLFGGFLGYIYWDEKHNKLDLMKIQRLKGYEKPFCLMIFLTKMGLFGIGGTLMGITMAISAPVTIPGFYLYWKIKHKGEAFPV